MIFALQFLPNKARLKYEVYTPPRTHSMYKWTKILVFLTNIFELKIDDEKWSRIFYFEILLAPSESEMLANLPGQFSLSDFFCIGQQQL